VEAKYHKAIFATVDQMKAAQARVLEHAIDEAMDGWERSKAAAKRVKRTSGKPSRAGGVAETDVTATEVSARVGDVRFLTEARAALADLRKLFGLDAAESGAEDDITPSPYV
jgi:hypothetical protein